MYVHYEDEEDAVNSLLEEHSASKKAFLKAQAAKTKTEEEKTAERAAIDLALDFGKQFQIGRAHV